MRPAVEVRPAVGDDLPGIAVLCSEARRESASGAQICAPDEDRLVRHLSVLLTLPGGNVLVALHDGRPVGFVLARVLDPHLFADEPSLYVEAVYVGRTPGAAGWATRSSARRPSSPRRPARRTSTPCRSPVPVGCSASSRGWASARWPGTASSRRRSCSAGSRPTSPPPAGARARFEDLIARRRRARTETMSGPVDLREFQAEYNRRAGVVTPADTRETLPG